MVDIEMVKDKQSFLLLKWKVSTERTITEQQSKVQRK